MTNNNDAIAKKIFAANLKRIMEEKGKAHSDLNHDLKFPYSTISGWTSGSKLPRMGTVETLAVYLGCEKSDLLDEPTPKSIRSKEINKIAEDIHDDSDLMYLYQMKQKMTSERFQKYVNLLKDISEID